MKSALYDRGYMAIVRFSEEDDCFYGKIEGIDGLILFEGQSVDELRRAFHEAVDDYLELCKMSGKKPQKSYKGSFNVRIDPELHREAARKSASMGISLNRFVQTAIEKELRHY
jgi:predicted HicB family RNase H-like nuclease